MDRPKNVLVCFRFRSYYVRAGVVVAEIAIGPKKINQIAQKAGTVRYPSYQSTSGNLG